LRAIKEKGVQLEGAMNMKIEAAMKMLSEQGHDDPLFLHGARVVPPP
jgi:hypothetical protein